MKPEDLALLRIPGPPTVAPDGTRAVVAVTRMDLDADAYRSHLLLVDTAGEHPPRRLTNGPRDTAPAYAPDGRRLAFLRAPHKGPAQLHLMPVDGGEPHRVVEHPLGVEQFTWSPDSTRVAYVARVPEEGRYLPDGDADAEPPRRITRLTYRTDDVGWTLDRPKQVFVVEVDAEEPQAVQVTCGDADATDPAWSPDGRRLAFVSARQPDREDPHSPRVFASDLFVVDLPGHRTAAVGAAAGGRPAGGPDDEQPTWPEPRQVTDTSTVTRQPVFGPDGRTLYYLGTAAVDPQNRTTGLFAVPADGSAPPRRLTDPGTLDLLDPFAPGRLVREPGGEHLLTVLLDRGAAPLARLAPDGTLTRLLDGARQVKGWAAVPGLTVATVATGTSAGEVVVRDAAGAERVRTDLGAELSGAVDLRPLEPIEATADDGVSAHGWVVVPAGPGPHPVLLSIHGGPYTQYGHTLFDEAQVYAGAGYAVVLANPRGSAGYGEAHGRAVIDALGDRDAADLLAVLDAALTRPDLDADRVGVMGGSYGGYMSAWLAATTDRFRAAWCERGLYAIDSFEGSSDIGWSFAPALYPGGDREAMRAQTVLTHVGRITCPVLIAHSEQDLRCPLEQAQRFYLALRRQGTPAEMLIFPGESHELSRSGSPSHRVQRFHAVLEWWSRHL